MALITCNHVCLNEKKGCKNGSGAVCEGSLEREELDFPRVTCRKETAALVFQRLFSCSGCAPLQSPLFPPTFPGTSISLKRVRQRKMSRLKNASFQVLESQVDGVWGRGTPVRGHAAIAVLLVIRFNPEFVSERLPLVAPPSKDSGLKDLLSDE